MADEDTFPLADVFTRPDAFAEWQLRGRATVEQRGREAGEHIAADERVIAARRRAGGLPPLAPVHPELVPELQREFEASREVANG